MDGEKGTPVTSGGEDNSVATEAEVTAYGDNSGTPITAGGDGAAAQDGGTPATAGGEG